jgi:hypothetical protein
MLLDAPPQRLAGGRPEGLVRLEVDLEPRPLQRMLPMIVHEQ